MKEAYKGRLIFYIGQIKELDIFTYELREAFEQLGFETFTYDLRLQTESLRALGKFCEKTVDAIITFNTMFYNMKLGNGKNAWSELGIKYITILVDHPYNFRNTLNNFGENEVVLCIDKKHMEYIGRFCKNVVTYGFLPHGGTELREKDDVYAFAERHMDVMYAGGIADVDINSLQIQDSLKKKYEELFDAKQFCIEVFEFLKERVEETVES